MSSFSVGYTFSYDKCCKKKVRQFSILLPSTFPFCVSESRIQFVHTDATQSCFETDVQLFFCFLFWQRATAVTVGWFKGHTCNNHSMHYTESPKLCDFYSTYVSCTCPAGCTPLLYCKDVHKYDSSVQFIEETLLVLWTTGLKVLQMCQGICWPYKMTLAIVLYNTVAQEI